MLLGIKRTASHGCPLFLFSRNLIKINAMMLIKRCLPFALIFLIAACASSPDATPTPLSATAAPTVPPPTVTLQFWTVLPDNGVTEQSLNDLVQSFQKEYPTITLKVSSQATYTDLYRKVVASIATGTLPDLVTGLDGDIAQYARLRALAPLDDYVGDPANGLSNMEMRDIPAGLLETTQLAEQDNKILSLPFARGVLALYYNWSAMKNIGITNTPKTWDEFKLHAKSLTKNPVRGLAYHPDATLFDALLASRGGSLFNADLTKATFNSTAGVDTLVYLSEGLKDNWIYRVEGNADLSDFAAGRAIFNVASTAEIPVYQAAIGDAVKKGGKDFEWGVTLLPQGDTKKTTAILLGSNIAILKGTLDKQRASWLFIRWLMRDKVAANWTQAAGVLPARQAARDLLKDFVAKSPPQKQAMDDLLPVAHPEPNARVMSDIRELIEAALASFDSGKVGPKAALDDAAAKATILLNEQK
jgi:multiple sugar transport system substrate-binding protein